MNSLAKKILVMLVLVTFGCNLVLTGCGTSSDSNKYSTGHTGLEDTDGDGILEGGTFVMALTGDIVKFDPCYCYDAYGLPIINQIVEPLLRFTVDEDTGKTVTEPCLAESYEEVSATDWIFHIRQGVLFSDGTEMTMDDVIFSIERARDTAYAAQMLAYVDTVEAIDDWTLEITLTQADTCFANALACSGAFGIYSKAYYEAHEDTFGDPNTGCIGTGPYAFESWTQGEKVVLQRNDYYWDEGAYLQTVEFDIIEDSATKVAGLASGDINAMLQVPIDVADEVNSLDNVNLQINDSFGIDFFAINCEEAPFDDVNVRKALNYCFDSATFAESVAGICGEEGFSGSLPDSMWVGDNSIWETYESQMETYACDIDMAKQCLSESEYPDGFTATITTDSDPIRYNASLYLQSAAKEIGINLEIELVSSEQLTVMSFESPKNYGILANYWGADFPDPCGILNQCFLSEYADGGANFFNFSNDEYDATLHDSAADTDQNDRATAFVAALQIIDEECPWVVIDYAKTTLALSSDLEGYEVLNVWYWSDFCRLLHYVE